MIVGEIQRENGHNKVEVLDAIGFKCAPLTGKSVRVPSIVLEGPAVDSVEHEQITDEQLKNWLIEDPHAAHAGGLVVAEGVIVEVPEEEGSRHIAGMIGDRLWSMSGNGN